MMQCGTWFCPRYSYALLPGPHSPFINSGPVALISVCFYVSSKMKKINKKLISLDLYIQILHLYLLNRWLIYIKFLCYSINIHDFSRNMWQVFVGNIPFPGDIYHRLCLLCNSVCANLQGISIVHINPSHLYFTFYIPNHKPDSHYGILYHHFLWVNKLGMERGTVEQRGMLKVNDLSGHTSADQANVVK